MKFNYFEVKMKACKGVTLLLIPSCYLAVIIDDEAARAGFKPEAVHF